jgi:hypothetical protein
MGFVANMFGGGKKPAAPDPVKTAQQAFDLSKQATDYNSGKYFTQGQKAGPFGGLATDPTTGAQTQQFGSGLLPSVNNVQGALGAQTGLLPTGAFDPSTDADAYRSAFVNQGLNYAMPQWGNEDDAWKTLRAERGLDVGGEIDAKRNQQVASNRNQYLGDLSSRAYAAGANEEQRQFGNQLTQYQLPGQMAQGMFGLLQGANSLVPGYNSPYQFNAADPANAYTNTTNNNYNQAMQQYNKNQEGANALLKTVGSIGMNAIMPGSGALMGLFPGGGSAPSGYPQSGIWNSSPTNFNWGGGGY